MTSKEINTFYDVEITKHNTLILCDIDETVLRYEKTIDHFYKMVKEDVPNEEEEFYKNEANDFYRMYKSMGKKISHPQHTDIEGFNNMIDQLEKINGSMMFITARNEASMEVTCEHLNDININHEKYKIHFTNNKISKGEYIKKNININDFNDIIFIDDYESYIKSVTNIFNDKIRCYRFKY